MLVLSRKAGQAEAIEGGITVTPVEIEGGRVRLGIDAPQCVRQDDGRWRWRWRRLRGRCQSQQQCRPESPSAGRDCEPSHTLSGRIFGN